MIDWGDGSSTETITTDTCTHTYTTPGEYTITMDGTINGFRFNDGGVTNALTVSVLLNMMSCFSFECCANLCDLCHASLRLPPSPPPFHVLLCMFVGASLSRTS